METFGMFRTRVARDGAIEVWAKGWRLESQLPALVPAVIAVGFLFAPFGVPVRALGAAALLVCAMIVLRMSRLGFRLDAADGSVCYTGDSGASDEIVALAKGCDVLIHMNHYFSGTAPSPAYRAACGNHKDNAETAKRAGVKTLVLTHLLGLLNLKKQRSG